MGIAGSQDIFQRKKMSSLMAPLEYVCTKMNKYIDDTNNHNFVIYGSLDEDATSANKAKRRWLTSQRCLNSSFARLKTNISSRS